MKVDTPFSKGLEDIFEWMNDIFSAGKFIYQDEEYVFHGTRIDYAEHALRVLRAWFESRLGLLQEQTKTLKGEGYENH